MSRRPGLPARAAAARDPPSGDGQWTEAAAPARPSEGEPLAVRAWPGPRQRGRARLSLTPGLPPCSAWRLHHDPTSGPTSECGVVSPTLAEGPGPRASPCGRAPRSPTGFGGLAMSGGPAPGPSPRSHQRRFPVRGAWRPLRLFLGLWQTPLSRPEASTVLPSSSSCWTWPPSERPTAKGNRRAVRPARRPPGWAASVLRSPPGPSPGSYAQPGPGRWA